MKLTEKRSLFLGAIILTLLIGSLPVASAPGEAVYREISAPPSIVAQVRRPTEVWPQVYEQLPDLPLENVRLVSTRSL